MKGDDISLGKNSSREPSFRYNLLNNRHFDSQRMTVLTDSDLEAVLTNTVGNIVRLDINKQESESKSSDLVKGLASKLGEYFLAIDLGCLLEQKRNRMVEQGRLETETDYGNIDEDSFIDKFENNSQSDFNESMAIDKLKVDKVNDDLNGRMFSFQKKNLPNQENNSQTQKNEKDKNNSSRLGFEGFNPLVSSLLDQINIIINCLLILFEYPEKDKNFDNFEFLKMISKVIQITLQFVPCLDSLILRCYIPEIYHNTIQNSKTKFSSLPQLQTNVSVLQPLGTVFQRLLRVHGMEVDLKYLSIRSEENNFKDSYFNSDSEKQNYNLNDVVQPIKQDRLKSSNSKSLKQKIVPWLSKIGKYNMALTNIFSLKTPFYFDYFERSIDQLVILLKHSHSKSLPHDIIESNFEWILRLKEIFLKQTYSQIKMIKNRRGGVSPGGNTMDNLSRPTSRARGLGSKKHSFEVLSLRKAFENENKGDNLSFKIRFLDSHRGLFIIEMKKLFSKLLVLINLLVSNTNSQQLKKLIFSTFLGCKSFTQLLEIFIAFQIFDGDLIFGKEVTTESIEFNMRNIDKDKKSLTSMSESILIVVNYWKSVIHTATSISKNKKEDTKSFEWAVKRIKSYYRPKKGLLDSLLSERVDFLNPKKPKSLDNTSKILKNEMSFFLWQNYMKVLELLQDLIDSSSVFDFVLSQEFSSHYIRYSYINFLAVYSSIPSRYRSSNEADFDLSSNGDSPQVEYLKHVSPLHLLIMKSISPVSDSKAKVQFATKFIHILEKFSLNRNPEIMNTFFNFRIMELLVKEIDLEFQFSHLFDDKFKIDSQIQPKLDNIQSNQMNQISNPKPNIGLGLPQGFKLALPVGINKKMNSSQGSEINFDDLTDSEEESDQGLYGQEIEQTGRFQSLDNQQELNFQKKKPPILNLNLRNDHSFEEGEEEKEEVSQNDSSRLSYDLVSSSRLNSNMNPIQKLNLGGIMNLQNLGEQGNNNNNPRSSQRSRSNRSNSDFSCSQKAPNQSKRSIPKLGLNLGQNTNQEQEQRQISSHNSRSVSPLTFPSNIIRYIVKVVMMACSSH